MTLPMTLGLDRFPSVVAAIQDGIQRSLHTGVQIYVSINARPVLNAAVGEAAPGMPMTAATIMPWRSAAKPITAALVLRAVEQNRLSLDSRLCELLPASQQTDKANITLLQLLTHQSGFPAADTGWPHVSWDESVQRSLNTPCSLEPGSAAYHPQSSWFVLGEILRELEQRQTGVRPPFDALLQRDLLTPLGMDETWCGIPESQQSVLQSRLPQLYDRDRGQLQPSPYSAGPWLTTASAGGNIRGPVSQLGLFLEMLLRQGQLSNGSDYLIPTSVNRMLMRHRTGLFDQTLQHIIDFGLGVIRDSKHYGPETVPYGFGKACSSESFGHGGSQCSIGFCDPAHGLVVVWSANGFCGEGQHQRRNRMINDAIYNDLGL